MSHQDQPEPRVSGRGLLLVEDFCRITGVDGAVAQALFEAGRLEGVTHRRGRVFGLFDDVLPTREQLRDMVLSFSSDYLPEQLRSYADDSIDNGADQMDARGTSWTMEWWVTASIARSHRRWPRLAGA